MGLFGGLLSIRERLSKKVGDTSSLSSEEEVSRLIDEGNTLEAKGMLDEAERCYKLASKLAPSFARAYLNRGNVLLAKEDTKGALRAYETALQKNPGYAEAYLNIGNAHFLSGSVEEAHSAYAKAVELKPDFAEAYMALGRTEEELGGVDRAIENYRKALTLKPDYQEAYLTLGNALNVSGRTDEAVASYRTALVTNPDDAEALSGLTNTLYKQGNIDELLTSIRSVLVRRPDFPEAHNNLGIALRAAGLIEDAIASHRKAIELQPSFAGAHHMLGVCLQQSGAVNEAIASYRKSLEISPDNADPLTDLGNALMSIERPDEALVSFTRALQICPQSAAANYNVATTCKALGRLDEAIVWFVRALEIDPELASAHNNLGICFNDRGQFDLAKASYLRAIEHEPNMSQAYNNLGITLQNLGQLDAAMPYFEKALEIAPEFADAAVNLAIVYSGLGQLHKALVGVRRAMQLSPESVSAHSVLLFLNNYLDDKPADELLSEAKIFGALVARKAESADGKWHNSADPDRRLRIGFVSGDFRAHPVGYFVEGVLSALASDPSRLELFAYHSSFHLDATTQRIKTYCDGWSSIVGLSDEVVYNKIRDDGIDILIDLSGHTLFGRLSLFAWKPAPVQVSWLGYFATTGVAEIDYLIADPWTLPPSEEVNFTETIVRLPETRLCFTPPDENIEVAELPALRNGYVTFGCFNTLTKMNDAVVALWSRILHEVPDSRLFLMSHLLSDKSVQQQTIARFRSLGIVGERLVLKGFAPRADYLATYNQVDIALDPFPYCGGTTTVEALWMGVPVLTLEGRSFLSRQGVGLLMNAGLPQWVAASKEGYVARAVAHAGDVDRLAAMRSGLRAQVLASPVFDAKRFAVHFEVALRRMWNAWCAQQGAVSSSR